MTTITKERVAEFIKNPLDNGLTRGEQMELARIALASLEVTAVMYASQETLDAAEQGEHLLRTLSKPSGDAVIPLFTALPAPVVDADLLHIAASAIEDLLTNKDTAGAGVWADVPEKLRRAAMLQVKE